MPKGHKAWPVNEVAWSKRTKTQRIVSTSEMLRGRLIDSDDDGPAMDLAHARPTPVTSQWVLEVMAWWAKEAGYGADVDVDDVMFPGSVSGAMKGGLCCVAG